MGDEMSECVLGRINQQEASYMKLKPWIYSIPKLNLKYRLTLRFPHELYFLSIHIKDRYSPELGYFVSEVGGVEYIRNYVIVIIITSVVLKKKKKVAGLFPLLVGGSL